MKSMLKLATPVIHSIEKTETLGNT